MNPLSTLQRPREHDEHSHRPPFRSPYDPQQPQYAPQDMDAQLSMAYLPLPVDTPLPASAFAVPNAGYNHPTHNPQQGPTGHPLYEGVLGMHYLLSQGMPWAEYSGHNSSRNDSRNDDDLFCQNPAPLVPLPIRPTASRLSSRSSLQSWQSDCTEQESHPEPSSSFQGSPLSTAMSNTTATTPTHSSEGSATFHVEKPRSASISDKPDPYAAGFIREKLGDKKWHIFTSRLAESRKSGQKSKAKAARRLTIDSNETDTNGDASGGASAVDFLVKVEVVKGVLRAFVPHPYNPLKSLTHPYSASPRGQVTLSRTTVLSLSGWSNTQFAYWARRAEGISVLSPFDGRLRLVAAVLQRQLIQAGVSSLLTESSQEKSDGTNPPSPKTTPPGVINFAMSQHELPDEVDGDPEKWVKTSVTGKGLDVMIDEVKKRCGVSPFLRGKHSSLDPFGAVVTDRDADGNITHREAPTIYMPTFQAEMYVHEISASVSSSAGIMATENLGKRKASPEVSQPSPEPQRSVPIPIPPPHSTSMTWPSLPSERHIENLEIHIDATPPTSHAQPPVIHTPSPSLMYPPDIFDTMGSMGIRTEHPSVIPSGPWNIDNFPLSHSRSQPGDVTMRSRSSSYSDRMPKKRKYSAPPVGVDSSAFGGYYQDLSSLSMSWDVHQMQGG